MRHGYIEHSYLYLDNMVFLTYVLNPECESLLPSIFFKIKVSFTDMLFFIFINWKMRDDCKSVSNDGEWEWVFAK